MTDKLYNNIVDKKYAEALVNIAFIKRELEEETEKKNDSRNNQRDM